MKNIIDIFKDENMKQDFINASQFGEDKCVKDLSFINLYVDYKINQICVQTGCKNDEGKDVVKAITYLIKDLNSKDNKIPAEIEECLKDM